MKKTPSHKILGVFFAGVLMMNGCYTVLMHPSMLTKSESAYSSQEYAHGDFTSDISYNQNCLSCHSQAELDDRYYDMERAGMHIAHGMVVDPYGWRNPTISRPWWDGVLVPSVPAAALSGGSPMTESGPMRRTTGSTRGGDVDRMRASDPPSTTTTSTATAPSVSPAASDSRSNTSVGTPASSTDRTRTTTPAPKDSPRKAGSTRGADPK